MQHFLTRQDVQPEIPHSYHEEYTASVKVSNNHSALFKFIVEKNRVLHVQKDCSNSIGAQYFTFF